MRPHPTEVPASQQLKLKQFFASRTNSYEYAFNPTDYIDFEIFNITKRRTKDNSHVGKALSASTKPVVFFLTYEVGYDKVLKKFIQHVVCCVAFGKNILFFDMRDLCDISKRHQQRIESELERASGLFGIHLHNACYTGNEYVYLQRFKPETEVGWCIAWALFFLNTITTRPLLSRIADRKKYVIDLYKSIDTILDHEQSNHPIERWYLKSLESLQ